MQNHNIHSVKMLTSIALVLLIMSNVDQAIAFNNPPTRCEGLGELQSISLTDWESGLGSWTAATHDVAVSADFDTPNWAVLGSLPDNRPGKAAFVDNKDDWEICEIEDKSGALNLDSPVINIPGDVLIPRISVDHWFAIEKDWDGGNFKISVNGGAFNLIPASAIEVGPYNMTLYPPLTDLGEEFNTNPLASQDAFSGPLLSWGQSHINLQGIATAGDTVRLRIDFGLDECSGDIGWYVDDVEFYSCSAEGPSDDTSLTLVKQVKNDNGGTASASAWTLYANGPDSFNGSGPSVYSGTGLAAGTYNLSESAGPSGYNAGNWICDGGTQVDGDTVNIVQDQVVTCTITNDDIAPTITVFKSIINDNGGTVNDPNAFGLKVNNVSVLHNVSKAVNVGNHKVSEDGLPGYKAGKWGGAGCNPDGTVTLVLDQHVTCTITNDDIDPLEIIFKDGFEE